MRTYPVDIDDDGRVIVVVEPEAGRSEYLLRRLDEGLEQGITLVVAKAVLGLLDIGVRPSEIVRAGVDFGALSRGGVGRWAHGAHVDGQRPAAPGSG